MKLLRLGMLSFLAILAVESNIAIGQIMDRLSANQIVQRAIDSTGGDALLNKITTVELIDKMATPEGDTVSFAIKRMGFNKYYASALSSAYVNTTNIFNNGNAVSIENEKVKEITDPIKIERFWLQSFISIDFAYKKLQYRLKRLADKKFEHFDCYVINATSPSGFDFMNFYDKATGRLIMVIYPDDSKTIFTDYYTKDGISIPSIALLTDNSGKITQSVLQKINFSDQIDMNWFVLPKGGDFKAPEIFKTGSFEYMGFDKGYTSIRTIHKDIEAGAGVAPQEFTIRWDDDNDYTRVSKNPAENNTMKVRIITWAGNIFYCQYLSSKNIGGTFALEKVK